jgi:hypothetical protein
VEADFSGCAYWIDAGRDIHIAGRAECKEKDDRAPVTQYLHVQVYWHPYPGRTYADPTATDALIRYVVATGNGVAVYSGTGFAFPQQKLGGELEVVVESGRLQLELRTGDAPDLLGETRLTAVLRARKDAGAAVKLIRTTQLVAAR